VSSWMLLLTTSDGLNAMDLLGFRADFHLR
jgi:hypothetical protein